ncbi:hypothetical protein [Aeriscardovia aeriphila]|uniref:Uncharacterized protein n=1 Tax=Aeriscardovia aeriphila TaxID=218139 RepID=A0A261FA75_9BIFI|nr:hypothetical protein [Aeriscardovia aeriphila]NYI25799.1 hypothetical protein [Aeriscardovia aeriphila]OZG56051.1 hypothetical protein AEAE_0539 [Aeriscardovia aeriphila]
MDSLEKPIHDHLITIATLLKPAWLICYHLAHQPGSQLLAAHSGGVHDGLPLNAGLWDQLEEVESLVRLAGYATGVKSAAYARVPDLARLVSSRAEQLASMADCREWERDLATAARVVAGACVENRVDRQQWYAVRVAWQPEQVATLVTQLTGNPVSSSMVRNLKRRGHISVSEGKACLGDVVTALEHHGRQ